MLFAVPKNAPRSGARGWYRGSPAALRGPSRGAEMRPFRAREVRQRPQLQNPLSLFGCAEKRKRLLMVSREKTLAAAFRASPGMLAAPVTGVLDWWKLTGLDHSTAYGSCKNWGNSRMPFCSSFAAAVRWLREAGAGGGSGCTAVLFCCRTSAVAGDWWKGHFGYPLFLSELPVPHSPDAALRPRNVGRSGAAFPAVRPSPAA